MFFFHQPLADPEQNTQQLTEQLRSLGLYAAHTLGDGNCLFRALSDQLYGSPSYHLQLRKDICDWIETHSQRYEPFCEDERGLTAHLRCMREQGALRWSWPCYQGPILFFPFFGNVVTRCRDLRWSS